MEVYNIKDRPEFIEEIAILTQREWGSATNSKEEFLEKIDKKINKIKNNMNKKDYRKLILVNKNELIGFISIFEHDCKEREYLSPWYATMFVKKEYRGKGYSKILNDEILKEAKKMEIKKLYLKTTLENYYEKFGAIFLEKLDNGEKLYYFDL